MTFRPSIESRPRRFSSWSPEQRSTAFDITLAVSLAILVSAASILQSLRDNGGDLGDPGLWWTFTVEFGCGLILLVRRSRPILCAAVVAVGLAYEQVLAAFFVAYALAVYLSDRRRTWIWVGVLGVVAVHPWDWRDLGQGIPNAIILLTPVFYGLYVASRRRLFAALGERAERAEREQELRAEQARAEERNRLAGDMHDIVTHRVSLMVLQAGALRVRAADEQTRVAAEDLRSTGCQALAELRDLVAVLRTAEQHGTGAPVEPAVLDLSELVGESRAAGVDVRLDTAGPATAASPVVVRTAYRVAQEALTNVHKHAPGARVRVCVAYSPDHLRITVVNTAATRAPEIELGTGGTGLLGLQRRIELTGGSFRAGPLVAGGFELDARLPIAGPAAPAPRPDSPVPADTPPERLTRSGRVGFSTPPVLAGSRTETI